MKDLGSQATKVATDLTEEMGFRAHSDGNSLGAAHEHLQETIRPYDEYFLKDYFHPNYRSSWRLPLNEVTYLQPRLQPLDVVIARKCPSQASAHVLLRTSSASQIRNTGIGADHA